MQSLVEDGRKHPYNARRAQFIELCGNVGAGCRLAKTVVVGGDRTLINDILYVLSYFVRCSSVEQKAACKCLSSLVIIMMSLSCSSRVAGALAATTHRALAAADCRV